MLRDGILEFINFILRTAQDKSTFIFKNVRYSTTVGVPCVSFNESDKIRAINMPGECIGAIQEVLK